MFGVVEPKLRAPKWGSRAPGKLVGRNAPRQLASTAEVRPQWRAPGGAWSFSHMSEPPGGVRPARANSAEFGWETGAKARLPVRGEGPSAGAAHGTPGPQRGAGRGSVLIEIVGEPVAIAQRSAARGEYFVTVLRDQNGMLELRAQAPVDGDGRPLVLEDADPVVAQVDHGLDREGHPRPETRPGAAPARVGHLGLGVEGPPDAVTHEIPHHGAAVAVGERLDRRADVADPRPRADLRDTELQGSPRHLGDEDGLGARGADVEGDRRIPVKSLVFMRDVDVDDVAVPELAVRGDAVADDLVDRGADALGEALVVQRSGDRALGEGVLVHELVDFVGGDPRADQGVHLRQGVRRESPCFPHELDLLGRLDFDG